MTIQLTIVEAKELINSEKCKAFDIYCRMIDKRGKWNEHLSNSDKSIDDFIRETDNYGSFWLQLSTVQNQGCFDKLYQLIDENGEPL